MNPGQGVYFRMLDFARPYAFKLLVVAVCFALAGALEVASLGQVQQVLDHGFLNADPVAARGVLIHVALTVVGIMALKGFFSYFADVLNNGVSNALVVDVRGRVFDHYTRLPLSFHSHQRLGQMVSRLGYDAAYMQTGISDVVGRVFGSGLRIVFLVAYIFYLNWHLALQVIVIFPLAMGPLYFFGRKIRRYASRDQERMADLSSLAQEVLAGIRVVAAFAREDHERARFRVVLKNHYHAVMQKLRMAALSSPVMEVIGAVGIALMIYLAGSQVVDKAMTFGAFGSLMVATFSLYPHFKSLNGVNVNIQNAIAAGTRVFEVLDTPVAIADKPGAKTLKAPKRKLSFEHVTFAYGGGHAVLKDVSFELKAGQRLALVGPSGAGKSTLADLLPRFQDVSAGSVRWDGTDVRDASLESLRGQIGVVTQETFLFNDSIAANIAYGRPDASRAEVEEAAKAANAHAFVMEQAQGYDTLIGERGVRLSGGQRQRLAIARAILKNPPVLILDEATSALDTQSERLVQQALERLMRKRTTLVIAHRLSTVRHADEILVLDKGQVAQRGKHAELLKQGGLYARLYRMQFADRKPRGKK